MVAMKTTQVGHTVRLEMPYSEVCMHLRLAGTVRAVRVLEAGAQILNEDGSPCSFPITHGEAGLRCREMSSGVRDEEPGATFWYVPAT